MRLLGLLLPVMLLVVGCGKQKSQMPDRHHDTRLQFYFDEFRVDAQRFNVNIDSNSVNSLRVMKFVSDVNSEKVARGQTVSENDSGTIGTCATFEERSGFNAGFKPLKTKTNAWNEIWIDDDLTSTKAHPLALKELVYHELGHCLFGLDHAASKPHKIMSPEMSLNGRWLTDNWDALLIEFFASVGK